MNKTSQNITIVLLMITAIVLGAMLVSSISENKAYAAGSSVKEGDYVFGTGSVTGANDFVYLIDIAARQMNVYYVERARNQGIVLVESIDLDRAFSE